MNPEKKAMLEKALYLYKIEFVKAAEKSRAQINYLGQHSLLWGTMGVNGISPAFWFGVCAGLAIEWTKYRVAGNNFVGTLDSARSEAFITPEKERKIIASLKADIVRSHRLQDQLTLALTGTCKPTGKVYTSNYPFNNAYSSLKEGHYYYVSSGSHATAMYMRRKGKIDFYDPNIGEALGMTKLALQQYSRAAADSTCKISGKPTSELKEKTITITEFRPV
ncbi:hypothetical protein AB4582_03110 [Vibrio splendidus]|uniref:hypothetical protein n=1 Tax=Vibrio splendidus TaxID=29497 RepID=UPI000C81EC0E|nr:hypothetical protein [Vibrio splendidus]PMH15206.1 hypothetical protein BCU77_03420 [Vibrio splendidus]PMI24650.1 hypothetical protein BCU48_08175 [Vibrio splendidus]PMM36477.1 hypothetical protein BCT55_13125 [Vibrio splendidus]PMO76493.1 hypothetical protein BCT03_00820 [Vibrio splendidus]